MEFRELGATGVEVSKLSLGAMMFGAWGNPDHDDGIRIIHAALDAGSTSSTPPTSTRPGENEEIVGKALAGRRDEVVLATKFHGRMGEGPNRSGNSRRWIMQEVEASLRRLNTDWIDIYQVHRPEPGTDVDETLGALSDLVHAGKIRYLGSSTFPAESIVEAQWVAERRGRERFRCEQPPYSMLVRGIERDVLPTCERYGMGVISWSPLAGGWLSGRYRKGAELPASTRSDRHPVALRHVAARRTSASSRRPSSSPSSPRRPGSRSSTWRSRSSSTTRRSPPRSSARARWSTSRASSAPPTSSSPPTSSTASTRSPFPGTNWNPHDAGYQPPAIADPAGERPAR